MKYFLIIGLFLVFSQCTQEKKSAKLVEKKFQVKPANVSFNEQDNGNWAMTGTIRNTRDYAIKGNVEIILLDKNKKPLTNFTTPVNGGNPIEPGDSAEFKYTAKKEAFAGAKGIQANFIMNE